MATSLEIEEFIERQRVIDVLHRYCRLVDEQDLETMVNEVFAEYGSDDHGEGPVVGREAIREWFERNTANIATNAHNISNVSVEMSGDKATMVSTVTSWTWTRQNENGDPLRNADYVLVLNYHDELSKHPEGWRIDRRVLTPNGVGTHVVALGELPGTQSGIHALSRRHTRTT